jgi:DNA-binding transcriptional LysR family regulator
MDQGRPFDWNDAKLILAVARTGSFSGAALALRLDQATVSRRVADLEHMAGRPLFERRKKGARPTDAGLQLIEHATELEQAARKFERSMQAVGTMAPRPVRIAASEGIIEYLLLPGLLGLPKGPLQPVCDPRQDPLPPMTFVGEPQAEDADLAILTLGPNNMPPGSSARRVRRIGYMRFVPVAATNYLTNNPPPHTFDAISDQPLLVNHALYPQDPGLAEWNGLVEQASRGPALTLPSSSTLVTTLRSYGGLSVLPTYTPVCEPDLRVLDMAVPDMSIALWLSAHEDSLREPAVRRFYDMIAEMFRRSRWFR